MMSAQTFAISQSYLTSSTFSLGGDMPGIKDAKPNDLESVSTNLQKSQSTDSDSNSTQSVHKTQPRYKVSRKKPVYRKSENSQSSELIDEIANIDDCENHFDFFKLVNSKRNEIAAKEYKKIERTLLRLTQAYQNIPAGSKTLEKTFDKTEIDNFLKSKTQEYNPLLEIQKNLISS
jgi:hypothetical protein